MNELQPLHLTDAELRDATHLKQPCAQARALSAMGVPYRRRPDGTLVVGRVAYTVALAGQAAMHSVAAANGIRWSRTA